MPINLTLQSTDNDGIINLSSDTFNEREIMKKIQIEKEYGKEIKQVSSGKYWYVRLHNKEKILRKAKTREGLIQSIYDYYNHHEKTIEEIYKEMLIDKMKTKTIQATIDRYKSDFDSYLYDTDFIKIRISEIKQNDFRLLVSHFKQNYFGTMTKKTLNNIFSLINAIFEYARLVEYTQIEPRQFLRDYRSKMLKKEFFLDYANIDEEDADENIEDEVFLDYEDSLLIDYLRNHTNDLRSLSLLFCRLTGLRSGELVALKPRDFNLNKHSLKIRRTETFDSKNKVHVASRTKGKGRTYPVLLSDEAIRVYHLILEIRKSDSEFLFTNQNGRRHTRQDINKHLKSICKELGIRCRPIRALRKTYASECATNGVNPSLLANQLGHTTTEIAQKYYIKNLYGSDSSLNQLNAITH